MSSCYLLQVNQDGVSAFEWKPVWGLIIDRPRARSRSRLALEQVVGHLPRSGW